MSLKLYVARRVLEAIPLLLAVIIVTFSLIHAAPGDPVSYFVGEGVHMDPARLELIRKTFGLDRPLHEQFFLYVLSTVQGNLGYSFVQGEPVLQAIWGRVPATLLLMVTALLIASILGVLLGVIASKRQHSLADNAVVIGTLAAYSVPTFWLGDILLLVFGVYLRWFPIGGITSVTEEITGIGRLLDTLWHLILPAMTLGTFYLALITRLTRTNMMDVLRSNFITAARAKGVTERRVFYRHALKNALIPVITVIGLNFGAMLGGAVVTETTFSWPGLGRLMFESAMARDYPTLMGLFIVTSFAVIVASLVTDISYKFIDPRIKYG